MYIQYLNTYIFFLVFFTCTTVSVNVVVGSAAAAIASDNSSLCVRVCVACTHVCVCERASVK